MKLKKLISISFILLCICAPS